MTLGRDGGDPWFRRRTAGQGYGWNVGNRKGLAATIAFVIVAGVLALLPVIVLGETIRSMVASTVLVTAAALLFVVFIDRHSD